MTTLDNDLKAAFALLDLANFQWLDNDQWSKLPRLTKKGFMSVPLNRETFEDMQAASVFAGQWRTQARQIMKKPRLYRVEIYMYEIGRNKPWHAQAVMIAPAMVETLWKAIGEAGSYIMSENKGVDWDENRCKAVVKV